MIQIIEFFVDSGDNGPAFREEGAMKKSRFAVLMLAAMTFLAGCEV
jgi:hypothetical protein